MWHGGGHNEAKLLADSYNNSLKLAEKHQIQSIAFPAISCGVFGYPHKDACKVAVNTVCDFLPQAECVKEIIFACFNNDMAELYRHELASRTL